MKIQFTSNFPSDPSAKEAAGMPFGCVVQPFAESSKASAGVPPVSAKMVARCDTCFGYINPFVIFDRKRWRCSFCGKYNPILARYSTPMLRRELPELKSPIFVMDMEDGLAGGPELEGGGEVQAQPIHLIVVDISGTQDYLDLVKVRIENGSLSYS